MLECLIHTTDTFYRDPAMKDYNSDVDRASNMKQGYLQAVRPFGFKWGKLEIDPKRFLRVVIEDHWFNPAWFELEYDKIGNELCDRRLRFPLAKILSLGEVEALKSIEYNSTEKLSPIIKSIDLKTIAEVNNWDLQPAIIKLHGSAGDFSIQEDGGGDYTSLKTAVETEAVDISGGSTDANFYISGAWTNPDTGDWDIDGWTMGSNRMLIQTTGEARLAASTYNDNGTRHRIENATQAFDIEIPNVTLDGMQFTATYIGITTSEFADNTVIKNTIGKGTVSNTTTLFDMNAGLTSLINCLGYKTEAGGDGGSEGIYFKGSAVGGDVISCTISGFNDGIEVDTGTVTVSNSAVFNNLTDFDGTMTIDHCASDSASGTNAVDLNENASGEWDEAFTDWANGDFSVKNDSSLLYNAGTNTGAPTDDIIGISRPQDTTVDIGAFEFEASSILPINFTGEVKFSGSVTRKRKYNRNIGGSI